MSLKIEVLGRAEDIGKGRAQPIAIHYPGRRYPVEDKLFLGDGRNGGEPDREVQPGEYLVDVHDLVFPDAKRFNRLTVSGIKPKHLKKAPARAA